MKQFIFLLLATNFITRFCYPQNIDSLVNLGDDQYRSNNFHDAYLLYDMATKIDSLDSELYLKKGLALIEAKSYKNALKELSTSIQLDSNNVEAYGLRSLVRRKLGNEMGATSDLNKMKIVDDRVKFSVLDEIPSLGIRITEKSFDTEFIFDVPNTSKSSLFLKANEWIVNTRKKNRIIVQTIENDAGTIIGEGIFQVNGKFGSYSVIVDIGFSITIKVKDNKVKANIQNIIIRKGHDISLEDANKNGKIPFVDKEDYPYFEKEIRYNLAKICISLKEGMLKQGNEDDW